MADFVVAHILDDYNLGDSFTIWPLHVTVLPPFEAETLEEIITTLDPFVAGADPITAQLGDFAKFGTKNIAQKLVPNPELQALHEKLLSTADAAGWKPSGRYAGRYYTPHITRKSGRDFGGSTFTIDKLAIAESKGLGYRTVVAEMKLKGVK